MPSFFDTLAATEALEAAGMESSQARAVAIQLQSAATVGDPVTRPELDSALSGLELKLGERMATLLWRLFGGIVAVAGLTVAAIRYLPSP